MWKANPLSEAATMQKNMSEAIYNSPGRILVRTWYAEIKNHIDCGTNPF
jgi:hypothetical protein